MVKTITTSLPSGLHAAMARDAASTSRTRASSSSGGAVQRRGNGKIPRKEARQPGKMASSSAGHKDYDMATPDELKWNAVDMPSEAAAMSGEADADFYQGLDMDGDDYMGLTEVEGVQVVKEDDGSVRFVNPGKQGQDKKQRQEARENASKAVKASRPAKARNISESNDDAGAAAAQDNEAGASAAALSELPPTTFDSEEEQDEEHEEQDESHDGEDAVSSANHSEHQEADIHADFSLLVGEAEETSDVEDSSSRTWTGKELSQRLRAWKKVPIKLHPKLYTALEALSFRTPTTIQASSLPFALAPAGPRRDVVGIAQTGSGKTLAYSLPILHWVASNPLEDRQMLLVEEVRSQTEHGTVRLAALILTPTRELALQVTKHIQSIIDASSSSASQRWASVVAVTGGISEEKQRRLLLSHHNRGADIIVATPGRLWDMCKSDDNLTRRIKATRFLVVDEADRMIETGHFAEMENIVSLVRRADEGQDGSLSTASVRGGAADLQTFIFSATLSRELQHNLKRNKRSNKRRFGTGSTLDDLMDQIDFRDDDPAIIDLSTKTRIASTVVEIKSECLAKEKDLYLYYFLLRYPGRTLVFVNSIDGIRRLQPLLGNLGVSVHPLHSQLQQKQRLKNLDRFRSSRLPTMQSSVVLLATDVAARGLDVPSVDHVVHFQLPRSTDTYVHRSGRTARAGHTGVSLALIDPSEKRLWRDLCRNLQREDSLASMPIEYSFLPLLRERIELAREIDRKTHAQNKEAHDDAWLHKLAAEAEIDMSDDEGSRAKEDSTGKGANGKRQVAELRSRLENMLSQPLRARGISFKYLTGSSRDFLEGILADTQHEGLIGVQRSSVQSDLADRQRAANGNQPVAKKRKQVA